MGEHDRLSRMFHRQGTHWRRELARYGVTTSGDPEQVNAMHMRLAHHLSSEVDELLRCSDWKLHATRRNGPIDKREVTAECVDLWKFMLNLLALHGVQPEAFYREFQRKSYVVEQRVKYEQMRLDTETPVFICDLDGVLCDRDTVMLALYDTEYNNECVDLSAVKEELGREGYERFKHDFYRRGLFQTAPQIGKNRIQLDRIAAEAVGRILICTSRDVKRFPFLEYETYAWLQQYNVPYDAVVFDVEKDRATMWAPKTSVFVDDEEEHLRAMSLVCSVYRDHQMAIAVDDYLSLLGNKNDA